MAPVEHGPSSEWEELDVAELLEEAAAVAGGRARERVKLSTFAAKTLPPVLIGHRGRLRQILCTLLGNAIRHSPPGAEVVAAASARSAGNRTVVTFEISDEGGGIPEQEMDGLFDSNAHRRSSIPHHEVELDLPRAKRLATDLDGELRLASAPGLGCTATFVVPLDLADDEPAAVRRRS